VSGFALVAVAGFVGFRRLTGGRLPLSEDMNTDIIFWRRSSWPAWTAR
jgi:hypothetical protein